MTFREEVVWITGASSGIGKALAVEAIQRGSKVIVSSRNQEKLNELADQISKDYIIDDNLFILPMDITQFSSIEKTVDLAMDRWGSIDILINNAGISQRADASDTEPDVIKRIMDTNFMGPAILTKHVINHMIVQKRGHCVFVSSLAGKVATPLRSSYSASKMAIQGFADSLRAEVHRHGIKVTLIIPGFVKTDISLNALKGHGEKNNSMDPNQRNGITPQKAAKSIIRGVENNKREVYCGLAVKGLIALILAHCFPNLFSRIIRSAKVT